MKRSGLFTELISNILKRVCCLRGDKHLFNDKQPLLFTETHFIEKGELPRK